MVKPTTIQVVPIVAFDIGWVLRQLDANKVFLNGDLQDEVFMRQPLGFEDPKAP